MAVEKQSATSIFRLMSLNRTLLAAQGYIELDMPGDALAELDALGPEDCEVEAVLQMRLFVLMKTRSWDVALSLCRRLRELYPEGLAGYIHGAFCLHENGRTAEARDLLLSAPPILEDEATYYYNLACYSAVLGDINAARDYAQTSFELDEKFRDIAKLDPDLLSLHKEL